MLTVAIGLSRLHCDALEEFRWKLGSFMTAPFHTTSCYHLESIHHIHLLPSSLIVSSVGRTPIFHFLITFSSIFLFSLSSNSRCSLRNVLIVMSCPVSLCLYCILNYYLIYENPTHIGPLKRGRISFLWTFPSCFSHCPYDSSCAIKVVYYE